MINLNFQTYEIVRVKWTENKWFIFFEKVNKKNVKENIWTE